MNVAEIRQQAAKHMKSRAGQNTYTNDGDRRYFFGKPDNIPGNTKQKGYSDCSSAVRAAIRAATGRDIGSNTDAQVRNRAQGLVVHATDGYYPDESILQPGDCLYFKGNTSHVMDAGHVEMYTGPGELYGHGSGTGPKRHVLKDYCKSRATPQKRYFMTIRWILDGPETPKDSSGASRTLRRGDEGSDVAEVQTRLIALGYDCGQWGADGEFGRGTEAAVKAFQADHMLDVDGTIGPRTWAAQKSAEPSDEPEDKGDPEVKGDLLVRTGSWHVRTGPGAEYPSAGIVRGGDCLDAVTVTGWQQVVYNGETRYISEKAIETGREQNDD